jgi:hypothetical protein
VSKVEVLRAIMEVGFRGREVLCGEFAHLPPDAPRSVDYRSFPDVFIPPYYYPNPATGKRWTPGVKP